ncbi:cell division protein FtsQ/DivIB [Planctomicrobium sp. SH527]|uniref:cell division protein FtsQ/DivIB n=1 Tax=Planctomicrobium sp. SH527 TaxID=3448123 RepID=UPI003F5BBB7C
MSPKPPKGKAKTIEPIAPPRPAAWWRQPGIWICVAFIVVTVTLSIWLPMSLPKLSEQKEYQFQLEDTVLNSPNNWVPSNLLKQIQAESGLPDTVSLLDPDLCEKIAIAWEKNPWIKKVNSVQITRDSRLQVDAVYRVPAAFVEVPRGVYPVDTEGVLLPPADFNVTDTSRLPHIRRVKSLPQGGMGHDWGDPVVTSGAQLATYLAPESDLEKYWNRFGFAALIAPDVDPATAKPEQLVFEIETIGGSRITWGRPPGADELEPSFNTKLSRLQDYVTRFGGLDNSNGPQRIDIRMPDGISLHPLLDRRYQ